MLNLSMNIVAFDIGDVHTGIARCDALGMFATPYKSIATKDILHWLDEFLALHRNESYTFVIGFPKTMRGTESKQTTKIIEQHKNLSTHYPQAQWVLWDERLTSQEAKKRASKQIKNDKNYEHAVAAAIILQSYLEHLRYKRQLIDKE